MKIDEKLHKILNNFEDDKSFDLIVKEASIFKEFGKDKLSNEKQFKNSHTSKIIFNAKLFWDYEYFGDVEMYIVNTTGYDYQNPPRTGSFLGVSRQITWLEENDQIEEWERIALQNYHLENKLTFNISFHTEKSLMQNINSWYCNCVRVQYGSSEIAERILKKSKTAKHFL